jgi:acyl-coenzyme A synthetase/AMP-(fatty) acid ligase
LLADEDGYFWYAGCTGDMMKVSGQAAWPADVRSLLQEHPAVLESGVVGAADPDGLIEATAYVALKDSHQPSFQLARELQEFVKKWTTSQKYLPAVQCIDELPKTATGRSSD